MVLGSPTNRYNKDSDKNSIDGVEIGGVIGCKSVASLNEGAGKSEASFAKSCVFSVFTCLLGCVEQQRAIVTC